MAAPSREYAPGSRLLSRLITWALSWSWNRFTGTMLTARRPCE